MFTFGTDGFGLAGGAFEVAGEVFGGGEGAGDLDVVVVFEPFFLFVGGLEVLAELVVVVGVEGGVHLGSLEGWGVGYDSFGVGSTGTGDLVGHFVYVEVFFVVGVTDVTFE